MEKPARILIVHREQLMRKAIRRLLESKIAEGKYIVIDDVGSATDGMHMFIRHDPDLVISDTGSLSQGVDLKLLKDIRARNPGFPVIIISGSAKAEELAFAAGATDFLVGWGAEELLSAISQALAGG